jgi:glycosyltransferase involved in cell wall biosynthesis
MPTAPDVSVIISAYNRGEGLRATLESLLTQDSGGVIHEVIAVDNNSTDNTAEVIRTFVAQGYTNVRYVFEPQQGVSYGRNAGIRVAGAPILAFTDDDVTVDPGWIRTVKRHFDENPSVDYLTGKMMPIYETEPPAWLTRATSGPCVLRDRGDRPIYSEPGCFFPGWATANIAFRRTVFDRVGLFSGEFPRGQDLELIIRVWRANCRGMYAPDMRVSHRVTADRLTKAYHRMWHSREGKIRARVRFREIFDADNRVITGEPPVTRLFGVPRFLLREVATEAARCAAAMVMRDEGRAFAHEGRLRQAAHYALTCFRESRASEPASRPTDARGQPHRA